MDDSDEQERKRRAAARRQWPMRVVELDEDEVEDLSATTTMEERLAMVWRLTLDSWASSGRPIPNYRREDTPGRVVSLVDE